MVWIAPGAAVAIVGWSAALPKIPTRHSGLVKPRFTLPNAVFGPVRTVLYTMMAIAVRHGRFPARTRAVTSLAVWFALNAVWSPVFVGLQAPRRGRAVIVATLVALAATPAQFGESIGWRA